MKYKIVLDTDTQLFTVTDAKANSGRGITIQAAIRALEQQRTAA